MSRKLVIFLWFYAGSFTLVNGDCTIEDATPITIDDKQVAAEIKKYSFSDPSTTYISFSVKDTGKSVATDTAQKYFHFEMSDNILIFSTTKQFESIGKDADSNGSAIITMNIDINLKCGGSQETSNILLVIDDTSSHQPEFSQASYKYKVPMPIMQLTDITLYGDDAQIIVSDNNFANTEMTLSIDPADEFNVSVLKSSNKRFTAVFRAKHIIQLNKSKTYTLTATNSGKKSTSVKVTVEVNPATSLDSPSFQRTHYSYSYSNGGSLTPNDGDIIITSSKPDEAQYGLDDAASKYFVINFDNSSKRFTLSPKKDATVPSDERQLILTLSYTTDNTARTVLLVNTDGSADIQFEKTYYTATYSTEPAITLDEPFAFKNDKSSNIDITFDGYNDYFKAEFVSSNNNYIVTTTGKLLGDAILFSAAELIVPVTASKGAGSNATTVLTIRLPSFVMDVFDRGFYTADYVASSDYELDNISLDYPVKVRSSEYTTLSFEGYADTFKGSCDSTSLQCTIAVQNNLNSSVLSYLEELPVTLVASNTDGSNSGRAILLINLPAKKSTFSFTQPYFTGSYTIEKSEGESATIKLNELIGLEGANSGQITIVPEQYSEYFNFTKRLVRWNLNLVKNLEADVLSGNTELVIQLTARRIDNNDAVNDYATATLIIKLPDATTVAFVQPQYYGEYILDGDGGGRVVLDSKSEIELTDTDNSKVVLDFFSDNFAVEPDTNSKWTVKVKSPLNSATLTAYRELKLVLTVTKVGVSYGKSALTIKLPTFSFTNEEYSATYSASDDDTQATITVKEEITIKNIDMSLININLTKYTEYFATELINNKWTITVVKPLTQSIISKYGTIVTNLLAKRKTDEETLAAATLVISIQNKDSSEAPSFSTFTFYGDYQVSGEGAHVNLSQPIGFTDDSVDVSKVYLDPSQEYSSNFTLKPDSDKYIVTVSSPLKEDVLEEITSLVFTLVAEATTGASGYATLAIALPKAKRNSSVVIENHEILFSGTYKDGEFASPQIIIDTNSDNDKDISVQISNDLNIDAKYFSYTYANKILSVQVKKLPDNILNSTSVVPLKLAITDLTTTDTVYAVLNVEITDGRSPGGGDGGSTDGSTPVGLYAAVGVLAFLLILVLVGAIIFWYYKMRTRSRYAEMRNDEITTKPTFTKNELKKSTMPTLSSSSLRRPTGVAVGLTGGLPEESSSDQTNADEMIIVHSNDDKKVAFDDKVKTIEEIENANEEDEQENMQSVADRRPTKFVFGYPLELDVLDADDRRRESSDFGAADKIPIVERKKSVAFDENVERMHIDATEEDEDDVVEDAPPIKYRTEAELQIENEEKLPSQIFKEIF